MAGRFISVYVTAASRKEAREIARTVLARRLAACANIFPIESLYWWKGSIEGARELGILFKTRRSLFRRLTATVRACHSYDVPCIVALPLLTGDAGYLKWIDAETLA